MIIILQSFVRATLSYSLVGIKKQKMVIILNGIVCAFQFQASKKDQKTENGPVKVENRRNRGLISKEDNCGFQYFNL